MSWGQRGRILLVDDEEDVASGIRQLLEEEFLFYVRVARNAREAKREVVLDQFDVIVLDWILRGGHGRDVVEFVRIHSPDTAVIVYSGRTGSDSECTAIGASDFVEKTPDLQPLRNAIQRHVSEGDERRRSRIDHSIGTKDVLGAALLDVFGIDNFKDNEHLAIVGQPEDICHHLALGVAWHYWSTTRAIEQIDAAELNSGGDQNAIRQLVGECDIDGGTPTLHRGLLDRGTPMALVVRRAESLSMEIQQLLASAVRDHQFCRVGSDRPLQIDCRLLLVVTSDYETSPLLHLAPCLGGLVSNSVFKLPRPEKIPGGVHRVVENLISRRFGGHVSISQSVTCAVNLLHEASPWTIFRSVAQERTSWITKRTGEEVPIELEGAGLALFETLLSQDRTEVHELPSWDKIGDTLQAAYVCRALSQTEGNILKASKITGLNRKVIYKRLNQFSINKESFQRSTQRTLFTRSDRSDVG